MFLRGRDHPLVAALNDHIAAGLELRGFLTAHVDLLAAVEQHEDSHTGRLHLDEEFLQRRAVALLRWVGAHDGLRQLPLGMFADGPAAAAALLGAAAVPAQVRAVVCLDGRVDLAAGRFSAVNADTLLLVGEAGTHLADLNRQAALHIAGARLELVPDATQCHDTPRAISQVAWRTVEWFSHVIAPAVGTRE